MSSSPVVISSVQTSVVTLESFLFPLAFLQRGAFHISPCLMPLSSPNFSLWSPKCSVLKCPWQRCSWAWCGWILSSVACRVWLPAREMIEIEEEHYPKEVWVFSCTSVLGGDEPPSGIYCVCSSRILGKLHNTLLEDG